MSVSVRFILILAFTLYSCECYDFIENADKETEVIKEKISNEYSRIGRGLESLSGRVLTLFQNITSNEQSNALPSTPSAETPSVETTPSHTPQNSTQMPYSPTESLISNTSEVSSESNTSAIVTSNMDAFTTEGFSTIGLGHEESTDQLDISDNEKADPSNQLDADPQSSGEKEFSETGEPQEDMDMSQTRRIEARDTNKTMEHFIDENSTAPAENVTRLPNKAGIDFANDTVPTSFAPKVLYSFTLIYIAIVTCVML